MYHQIQHSCFFKNCCFLKFYFFAFDLPCKIFLLVFKNNCFLKFYFFCFWFTFQKNFAFSKKKKKSISETVKINRNKVTLAFSVTFKFFDIWLIIFLKWFHKVCIIRLVHICFEKSSSTFWQVHCCAHRTRRSCQKYDEDFVKFCGLLRKPKL